MGGQALAGLSLRPRPAGTRATITVADEVWLATAALHLETPRRADFTMDEIVQRVQALNLYGRLRTGVRVHASLYCVANKKPNPGGGLAPPFREDQGVWATAIAG